MTMTLRCSEDEDERGPDCNKWLQELSYNLRSVSSSATVVIKLGEKGRLPKRAPPPPSR
ncbi:hypothetical protein F2Q68_00017333 [Brassica cretica]|uniref:Uncharacterized protein n=1 Tax=Brassica cretica TaxID=69181 RepID=A0A8S9HIJ7_BRACR|nr:hypothetical protein F2Q68_00017333 [Brassica cretica]